MTLTVKQQSMVDFVNFTISANARLQPFTTGNSYIYVADRSYFGGTQTYVPGVPIHSYEQTYSFEPITVEEYEEETDSELDPGEDASRKSFLEKVFGGRNDWRWPEYHAMADDAETHVSGGFDDAPWAAPMSTNWTTMMNNRLQEVDTVRSELTFVGSVVLAAGQAYADLDAANGRFVDATGQPLE